MLSKTYVHVHLLVFQRLTRVEQMLRLDLYIILYITCLRLMCVCVTLLTVHSDFHRPIDGGRIVMQS